MIAARYSWREWSALAALLLILIVCADRLGTWLAIWQ